MSLAEMDVMVMVVVVMDMVVLPCSPTSSHCCSVFPSSYNKACRTIQPPTHCFEVYPSADQAIVAVAVVRLVYHVFSQLTPGLSVTMLSLAISAAGNNSSLL